MHRRNILHWGRAKKLSDPNVRVDTWHWHRVDIVYRLLSNTCRHRRQHILQRGHTETKRNQCDRMGCNDCVVGIISQGRRIREWHNMFSVHRGLLLPGWHNNAPVMFVTGGRFLSKQCQWFNLGRRLLYQQHKW